MSRLWTRVIRNHRIVQQQTAPCTWGQEEPVLVEMCKGFDIPCPIWLNKHRREYQEFRRTAFLPEHFMEEVSFDKLEIEFLDDENKKRRSTDPRNQFDGF